MPEAVEVGVALEKFCRFGLRKTRAQSCSCEIQ